METTLTSNKSLLAWLDEKVELTKPSKIVWIDGSKEPVSYTHLTLPTTSRV